MKDTIIINTISKIHSAIISFFSFIIFTLFFSFIVLQNGLYLEDLSISNINIKKLYLKWDQKLELYVDELQITPTDKTSQNNLSKSTLIQYTKNIYYITNLFDSIVISDFTYNGFKGEAFYKSKENIRISLHSKNLLLKSTMKVNKEFTDIKIQQLKYNNIAANGNIYLNLNTLESFSKLNFSINNDANLTLYTSQNHDKLYYKAVSYNKINDLKAIMAQIPFPKAIHYWIFDAIKLDSLDIYTLNGMLDLNNLSDGYKNIHVTASANKLHYTYNPKLDAVHTDHTDLEFKKGVLYIRPQGALSYDFNLQKSWLKIDFTKKEELLTLFLKFSPTLNTDMLNLLKTYKISLPIKQNSGHVDTDLTLSVNLQTIGVDAHGTFFTKQGNFHYLGQDIDVENLKLVLDNYNVAVKKMKAHYKNMIDASVDINYNAKESKGDVQLDITRFAIKDQFKLAKKPLKAVYYIDKEQDLLTIESSSWLYKNFQLNVDKIDMPLDINSFKLNVPTTYFALKNISDGFISGDIDLNKFTADMDIDILNFKYFGIKSTRSNTPFKLLYEQNKFSLKAIDDIYLNAVSTDVKISNLALELTDEYLYAKNPTLSFGKFTQARLYAKYDLEKQKAHFSLNDLVITNPRNNKTLYSNKKVLLNASIKEDKIKIESKELRSTFNLDNKQWSLKLNSLENLYRQSDFMRKYHLDNGEVEVYKKLNDDTTRFKAKINYPYKFLYDGTQPVENYKITGRLTKKQNIYVRVNHNVNIAIKDDININIQDSNISLPETMKLFSSIDTNESNESNTDVNIKALNSAIYFGNSRYAISDNFLMQYHNHIITAQLEHKKGKAGFKLEDNKFHLYGEGFGDEFMGKLFVFSKFKNGTFDFNIDGTLDKYSGTLLIQKSTLLDYFLLNNVLAFINTVPSLVTFSVPGYSQNGVYMNHAYLKFDYAKGIYTIDEMYMDSKELKISAQGKANVDEDTINMSMNLKTDIASDISKIPLVGYIIFDGKAISTSVEITGKLSDPTIKSTIAQEVIVAPLNIIKRTLKLPFKIFE